MSSHREAPEISKDPVADSTDLYAFVSPDRPDTVTLIANYIPLEDPGRRPQLLRVRRRRAVPDQHRQRRRRRRATSRTSSASTPRSRTRTRSCTTRARSARSTSPNWNRRQFYTVTRITMGHSDTARKSKVLGTDLPCPPCNIGPRSTPNYAALADRPSIRPPTGEKVFAGQRLDGFFVDLGSIFDLGDLRPFQNLHLHPDRGATGRRRPARRSTCTRSRSRCRSATLTRDGSGPDRPDDARGRARRVDDGQPPQGHVPRDDRRATQAGPCMQVSRLGNPLFNEVIVPMGDKDRWNRLAPERRRGVRRSTSSNPSSPSCSRCSTRACSRTWPR